MARYNELSKLARDHKRRTILRRAFATVACLVVFVTTYMLILPALTLETELICNVEEHKHGDSCYTTSKNLICGEDESDGHSHSSSCYSTNKVLNCNDESEGHAHTDSCYKEEKELVCGQKEYRGHSHGSSCYEEVKELTCSKKEHSHTDGCYKKKEEATTQDNTEQLGEVQDQAAEEVATEATTEQKVEGDPTADLETEKDWKASVSGVELTGDWAKDLVAIAESQKGYRESSKNYIVENDGTKKGYTRYGAWYGDPYGDWCAMFVSFCLDYAKIGTDYFPQESECTKYIELLDKAKLYHSASSDYEVKAGDIIFFDNGSKKLSDHVGIVTKVTDDTIYTIEGNHGDVVGTEDYAKNADKIVGYGELPENPEMVKEEATTEKVEEATTSEKFELSTTTSDGIKIVVKGNGDVLPCNPDEVIIKAKKVEDEEALSMMEEAVGKDTKYTAYIYDITLEHGGKEIEPTGKVTVKFYGFDLEANDDVKVFHIEDDTDKAVDMDATINDNGTLKFETDGFSKYGVMMLSDAEEEDENAGISLAAYDPTFPYNNLPLSNYITSVSGEGTKLEPGTDHYTTDLTLNFRWDEAKESDYGYDPNWRYWPNYWYILPEGVIVPEDLLSTPENPKDFPLWDGSGNVAGLYSFRYDEDQKVYFLDVMLDKNYTKTAGSYIEGFIKFDGLLIGEKTSDSNGIHVQFSDKESLDIPYDQIETPDNETINYDLDVSKTASYSADTGELKYSVYISSLKGTPNSISFKDFLNMSGLQGHIDGDPTITVQKGTRDAYYQWDGKLGQFSNDNLTPYDVTPSYSNGEINMSLSKLDKAESIPNNGVRENVYKIDYVYKLKDLDNLDITAVNEASVTAADDKTGKNIFDSDKTETPIHTIPDPPQPPDTPTPKISKSGTVNSDNTITWTITVNDNHQNLANAKLLDAMFGDITGDATVSPNSNWSWIEENGKKTGIQFSGAENTAQYTITYKTPYTGSFDGISVTNTATFDLDGDTGTTGDGKTENATVNIPGGGLEKKYTDTKNSDDDMNKIITWEMTINVPAGGIPRDTKVFDNMHEEAYITTPMHMTKEQILAWGGTLSWEKGKGNISNNDYSIVFKTDDGTAYTYNQVQADTSGRQYTQFEIVFNKDITRPEGAEKVVFSYDTTAPFPDDPNGYYYTNKGYLNDDKKADVGINVKKIVDSIQKMDENGQSGDTEKDNTNGVLIWKLKAVSGDNRAKLTLTDTLPENVILDKVQANNYNQQYKDLIAGAEQNLDSGKVKYTYNASTRTVEIEITPSSGTYLEPGKEYWFTLNCHIDEAVLEQFKDGQVHAFDNTVTMKKENGDTIGTSHQKQNYKYEEPVVEEDIVDKSGTYNQYYQQLQYSIVLNPEGKDLIQGSDKLTVTDTLHYFRQPFYYGKYYTLNHNSVKLYYAVKQDDGTYVKGTQITNFPWTYEEIDMNPWYPEGGETNNVLTGTVPDNTPLILEYAYDVSVKYPKGPDGTDNNALTLQATNTAKLQGDSSYSDTDDSQNNTQYKESHTSGGVRTDNTLGIIKVDKTNYSKILSGAEFTITKLNTSNGQYDYVTKMTTDINGSIRIDKNDGETSKGAGDGYYKTNTLYKLVETKAPDGYLLPDSPQEVYFYFSDTADTVNVLPENLPFGAYDLSKVAPLLRMENEKLPGNEVSVQKKWFDESHNPIQVRDDVSITFDLYELKKAQNEQMPTFDANTLTAEQLLSAGATRINEEGIVLDISNLWRWEETIPVNEAGYQYAYYVIETSTGQYSTAYQGQGTYQLEIDNTKISKQPDYTSVTITKEWKGKDGQTLNEAALVGKSAQFKLMKVLDAEGSTEPATQVGNTFTLPESGSWTKTFENLPKTTYDADENPINWKYYFEEVESDSTTTVDYEKQTLFSFLPFVNGSENAADAATDGGTITVTNTLQPKTTSVSVEKKWKNADGTDMDLSKLPANTSVKVDLYKITDNAGTGEKVNTEPITLNATNEWKYENTNLVKEEYKDGVKHTYTYYFVETEVSGYSTTYKNENSLEVSEDEVTTAAIDTGTFTVINTQQLKDSVTVNKKWFKSVNGNVTEITDRTGSISFDLYRLATWTGGDEPVDPVDPTCEHTWSEWTTTKNPTETEAGEKKRICSKCNAEETQSINPTGHTTHSWNSGEVTTAATCTTTGVFTYTCNVCDATQTQTIAALGHDWNEWQTVTEPGPTTQGLKRRTCKRDGSHVEEIDIDPTGGGSDSDETIYTVDLLRQMWNDPTTYSTKTVRKGQSVVIRFKCTDGGVNVGWYTGDDPNNGAKIQLVTIDQETYYPDPNNQYWTATKTTYEFTYTPTADTKIYLYSPGTDEFISMDVVDPVAPANAAKRMKAAPSPASVPASETPTIPTDAVKVGSFQIHSDTGWTFTKEFSGDDVQPGYTYTYYVVETGNDNLTTTYVGEGTNNITINNTITENTYELPHTGGMGTTPFTISGLALLAAAGGIMINKKRRKEANLD